MSPVRTAQVIRRLVFSEWGGTETVVWNTAKMLCAAGNDIEIYATSALSEPGDEVREGVTLRRRKYFYPHFPMTAARRQMLDKKGGNPFVPGLADELAAGKFDLLHCHNLGRLAQITKRAARKSGVPFVVSLHGGRFSVPAEEMRQMLQPLRWTLPYGGILDRLRGCHSDPLEAASGIVCVGANELAPLREHYPEKLVIQIPNGVDYDFFHQPGAVDFRAEYGIPRERKILLCVSRIDYQKNQLLLPEVLKELGADWHLVLIGPATAEWYRDRLLLRISELGVNDRVTIIPGLPPASPLLPAAYQAAEVFALPSLHEPFGIVAIEAWSAGVPVVAAPVGGLQTLIQDGVTGFFAAPDAAGEWCQRIREISSSAALRNNLIAAADAQVRQRYTWRAVTQLLLDFYREVRERFNTAN